MRWLVGLLSPKLTVRVARRIYLVRRLVTGLLRRYRALARLVVRMARSIAGPKIVVAMAGTLIATVVILVRVSGITSNRIVVMPLMTHGEPAAPGLGESLAASLVIELNKIRRTYSSDREEEIARRVSNAPMFAQTVVLPAARPFTSQPDAVQVTRLRLGPVSIPLDELAFRVLPKHQVTVVNGTVEHYGDWLRVALTLTHHPSGNPARIGRGRHISSPSPCAGGGRSPELAEDLIVVGVGRTTANLIEDVAHQLVGRCWVSDGRRRWEALRALTRGLDQHQEYLRTGALSSFEAAEGEYRAAMKLEPLWDKPMLSLASLLSIRSRELEVVESLGLFRQAGILEPGSSVALAGEMNGAAQILLQHHANCTRVPSNLQRLLSLLEQTQGVSPQGEAISRRSFYLARGGARFALATLKGPRQACADVASPFLASLDREALLLGAASDFHAAETTMPGVMTAEESLAIVHSLLADHYRATNRLAEAARALKVAIETKERLN